jgi:hypothetical protein
VGDRLDELLDDFCQTPCGLLGAEQPTAEGMCERVSLALLATEREGINGRLWNMANVEDPARGGPAMASTTSSRSRTRRSTSPPGSSTPQTLSAARTARAVGMAHLVNPDDGRSQRFTEYITPRWRDLLEVDPPGDELGCPDHRAQRVAISHFGPWCLSVRFVRIMACPPPREVGGYHEDPG